MPSKQWCGGIRDGDMTNGMVKMSNSYQQWGPLEIALAHEPAHTPVALRVSDKEAAVAHMTTAARVVGLDIETAETALAPVLLPAQVLHLIELADDHDGAEVAEPVQPELLHRQRLVHRVRVALLDLAVELVAQIRQQQRRDLRRR